MFPGFTRADFDAYQPKKWKSNVFNRERLEVKQKLAALGRLLEGALLALDGSPLAVESSVEHPALWNHKQVEAQHLWFARNEGARRELDGIIERGKSMASMIDDPSPQRNHLLLAVSLSEPQIDLALQLHPEARVDRENLERKCADHFEMEKLLHLVRGLGAPFSIGITPTLAPVQAVDEAGLRELLAALGRVAAQPIHFAPGSAPPLLFVGATLSAAEAAAAGAGLGELVKERLLALLPLYHFIAWSRDNDFVSIRETLQKEKQQKRQKGLSRHDSVRIIRGMFSGKEGVIQEIDAKGALRILVGKLTVKVDAEDVVKS